jgi:hypothetical protein
MRSRAPGSDRPSARELRDHAAHEAAPVARPGCGGAVGREDVVLAEARAVREHAAVEGRLGAHVTPRSMAKARQSPSL